MIREGFDAELDRLMRLLRDGKKLILELEGRERPCYLTFRRVDRDVFIVDDCTGDLAEAQEHARRLLGEAGGE